MQDIVCTVNIMLGLPNNARRSDRARSLDRRADDAADASCWVYEQNGRIALTSADDIAAIDIEVEGASTDEVSLLLRHKDFSMIGPEHRHRLALRHLLDDRSHHPRRHGSGGARPVAQCRTCRHTLCRHYRP